jgi:hypothetical protein
MRWREVTPFVRGWLVWMLMRLLAGVSLVLILVALL